MTEYHMFCDVYDMITQGPTRGFKTNIPQCFFNCSDLHRRLTPEAVGEHQQPGASIDVVHIY